MPDALSLLNVNDTRHLEHLTWVAYDGALLVGVGGGDLSYLETASGVLCWQACTSTFTGDAMMQPTACHIC